MINKRSFLLLVYSSILILVMSAPAYAISTTIEPTESIVNRFVAYSVTLDPAGGPPGGFYFLNITVPAGYTLFMPASGHAFGTYTMLNITSGTNKVIIIITSNTNDPNGYSVNVTYSTDYGATYSNSDNQNMSNMLIGATTLNMTKPTASTPGYVNITLGGTGGPIDPATNNVTVTLASGTLKNPDTPGLYTWYIETKNSPTDIGNTSSNVVRITHAPIPVPATSTAGIVILGGMSTVLAILRLRKKANVETIKEFKEVLTNWNIDRICNT